MSLFRRKTTPQTRLGKPLELAMRLATPDDGAALARLAALDSAPVPRHPVLLAEVGSELWAAVSLHDLAVVADPFRPSGELVFTTLERARRLTARDAGAPYRRRARPVAVRLRAWRLGA